MKSVLSRKLIAVLALLSFTTVIFSSKVSSQLPIDNEKPKLIVEASTVRALNISCTEMVSLKTSSTKKVCAPFVGLATAISDKGHFVTTSSLSVPNPENIINNSDVSKGLYELYIETAKAEGKTEELSDIISNPEKKLGARLDMLTRLKGGEVIMNKKVDIYYLDRNFAQFNLDDNFELTNRSDFYSATALLNDESVKEGVMFLKASVTNMPSLKMYNTDLLEDGDSFWNIYTSNDTFEKFANDGNLEFRSSSITFTTVSRADNEVKSVTTSFEGLYGSVGGAVYDNSGNLIGIVNALELENKVILSNRIRDMADLLNITPANSEIDTLWAQTVDFYVQGKTNETLDNITQVLNLNPDLRAAKVLKNILTGANISPTPTLENTIVSNTPQKSKILELLNTFISPNITEAQIPLIIIIIVGVMLLIILFMLIILKIVNGIKSGLSSLRKPKKDEKSEPLPPLGGVVSIPAAQQPVVPEQQQSNIISYPIVEPQQPMPQQFQPAPEQQIVPPVQVQDPAPVIPAPQPIVMTPEAPVYSDPLPGVNNVPSVPVQESAPAKEQSVDPSILSGIRTVRNSLYPSQTPNIVEPAKPVVPEPEPIVVPQISPEPTSVISEPIEPAQPPIVENITPEIEPPVEEIVTPEPPKAPTSIPVVENQVQQPTAPQPAPTAQQSADGFSLPSWLTSNTPPKNT